MASTQPWRMSCLSPRLLPRASTPAWPGPHDRGRRPGGGAPGGGHPDRVRVRRDLVDPHAPGARRRGERGHGDGRVVALGERPRLAVRRREQPARYRLRDAPTSTGKSRPPIVASSGRPASSSQLCASGPCRPGFLLKPRPGSSTIIDGSTPSAITASTRRAELVVHLADHVGVDGPGVHVVAVPAPVHHHVGHARLRHQPGHVRVGESAAHVVDQADPGLERQLGHLGAHRVHADHHPGPDQFGDDRLDPAQLLVGGDPLRARPGRLAADVDDVGALGDQLQAVLDRRPRRRYHWPPSENESGVTLTTPITRQRSGGAAIRADPGNV